MALVSLGVCPQATTEIPCDRQIGFLPSMHQDAWTQGSPSLRGGFKRERGVGASRGSGSQPRGQRAREML
jgi:hypothetical protein